VSVTDTGFVFVLKLVLQTAMIVMIMINTVCIIYYNYDVINLRDVSCYVKLIFKDGNCCSDN